MSSRRKVTALSLVGLSVVAALAPAAPSGLTPAQTRILNDQQKVVVEAQTNLDSLHQKGEISPDDPRLALWSLRLVDIERARGQKAGLVAALQNHLAVLKKVEAVTSQGYKDGRKTVLDVEEARFRVLEAELMLDREQAQ